MAEQAHSIPITCACGKRYRVPEKLEGKLGRCPSCGMVIRVPFAARQVFDTKATPPLQEGHLAMEPSTEREEPSDPVRPTDHTGPSEPAGGKPPAAPRKRPRPSRPSPTIFLKGSERLKEFTSWFQRTVLGLDPSLPVQRQNFKPLLKRFYVFLAVFGLLFFGYIGWLFSEGAKAERAFKTLNQAVVKAQTLEQRQDMYRRFIAQNPNSKYILDVRKEMAKIPGQIDDRDFNGAVKAADALGDRYEEAEKEYLKYVASHRTGKHLASVQKTLSELPKKIDDRDYQRTLKEYETRKEKPDEAEKALLAYLNQHPAGKHAGEIKGLLKEIPFLWEELEFRDAVKEAEALGDRYEEWPKPLRLYLEKHPGGRRANEARGILAGLPDKIDDRDFEQIRAMQDVPYSERATRYRSYLAKYQQGRHVKETADLLTQIPVQWSQEIVEQVKSLENEGKRADAFALCRSFLKEYPEGEPARAVHQLMRALEAKNVAAREEQEYRKAAAVEKSPGATLQQTEAAYRDFLKKHPNSAFAGNARDDLKRLGAEMVAQEWESVRKRVATPGISAQKAMTIIDHFMRANPEGAHLKEAERVKEELKARLHMEQEQASWNQTLAFVQTSRDVYRSLDMVERFLSRYPDSALRLQALQQIITLESMRYTALSPYPSAQAPCTLRIKSEGKHAAYILAGSVQEMDASTYLVRDRANDIYYIKKNEVLGMECSPQAQYNSYIGSRQPRTAEDFKQIALWSQKAGLPDKVLINLVMAAYLRPDDSSVAQQLAGGGFAYEHGRWKSSSGIW